MDLLAKVVGVCFGVLSLLNGLVFLGTVIALLKGWIGWLAYVLWIFVAPILVPAMLGLPWFAAWVDNEPVNDRIFWLWAAWMGFVVFFWTLSAASNRHR